MARENYCLQGQVVQCPMVGEFGKAKFYFNGKKEKRERVESSPLLQRNTPNLL